MVQRGNLPSITLEQQHKLFIKSYQDLEDNCKDISSRPSHPCVKKYGQANWEKLSPEVREFVLDLRFRGDYKVETRTFLQKYVINNDL